MQLNFETMEEAVAFATKIGLDYAVIAAQESVDVIAQLRYDKVRKTRRNPSN